MSEVIRRVKHFLVIDGEYFSKDWLKNIIKFYVDEYKGVYYLKALTPDYKSNTLFKTGSEDEARVVLQNLVEEHVSKLNPLSSKERFRI